MPSAKAIDKLRAEIVRRHEHFSPRLKQVARLVVENPNDMGFESLSDIAARCDVRPSTIVRFAKALGFKGGSALQRLFRD
jgi:DNA-binding MurR/RpiR family transcriptional regulator